MIIKIFEVGTYPQGRWDRERVQKLVDAYDPENGIEAPCVVGHHNWSDSIEGELAQGWVSSLSLNAQGEVWADINASEQLREWVATRKLGYVSVGLIAQDETDESKPPLLRHVAFLGRTNPQITTTKLPALFSCAEENEDFDYYQKIEFEEDLNSGLTAVKNIPESTAGGSGELKSGIKEFGMSKELEGRIAELESQNQLYLQQLDVAQKTIEDYKAREEESAIFKRVDELVERGKLAPAAKEDFAKAALAVPAESRESFFAAMNNAPGIPAKGEEHFAKDGASPRGMSNQEIRAFAAERKISFEAAVEVLHREGRLEV